MGADRGGAVGQDAAAVVQALDVGRFPVEQPLAVDAVGVGGAVVGQPLVDVLGRQRVVGVPQPAVSAGRHGATGGALVAGHRFALGERVVLARGVGHGGDERL